MASTFPISLFHKTVNVMNVAAMLNITSRRNGLSIVLKGQIIAMVPATTVVTNIPAPVIKM